MNSYVQNLRESLKDEVNQSYLKRHCTDASSPEKVTSAVSLPSVAGDSLSVTSVHEAAAQALSSTSAGISSESSIYKPSQGSSGSRTQQSKNEYSDQVSDNSSTKRKADSLVTHNSKMAKVEKTDSVIFDSSPLNLSKTSSTSDQAENVDMAISSIAPVYSTNEAALEALKNDYASSNKFQMYFINTVLEQVKLAQENQTNAATALASNLTSLPLASSSPSSSSSVHSRQKSTAGSSKSKSNGRYNKSSKTLSNATISSNMLFGDWNAYQQQAFVSLFANQQLQSQQSDESHRESTTPLNLSADARDASTVKSESKNALARSTIKEEINWMNSAGSSSSLKFLFPNSLSYNGMTSADVSGAAATQATDYVASALQYGASTSQAAAIASKPPRVS